MTFRISQFAVVLGLSVLALPGVAQMPRYQSPVSVPETPQPQLTLPTPAPITPNGTVVEDVIVRVNDQIINRSDVERAQQDLAREDQQTNATPAEVAQRQKDMLRDMIDKQLLLSKGKELGLSADAEVVRRLDEIRKQNHLDSMEALEKAAASQGVSFEDFKANIRDNIITQQVVRDEVGRRLQMTQGQEQTYYDAHKQDFAQPEQVRLSEILIPTGADANDEAVAQAKAKADDIEAKIKAGGKFDEVAKANSGGPTASQGGDLGLFKRGALAKVLEDQTFDLPAGQVTAPIRTRQGFVILKVTEHQAAGTPGLKDVEQQVQEAMYMDQLQPALRAYLTKLREDAYIDIAAGFVDSGASANESKPLFTASTLPTVKKKKVQKKQRYDRSSGTGRFAASGKKSVAPAATTAAAPVATPVAAVTTASNGKKHKKLRREKIRFGQAPRNTLPAGPEQTAVGGDVGAGSASASAITVAPGAAMTNTEESASQSVEANPLTPTAPEAKKSRYASREKIVLAEKKAARRQRVREKAAAKPAEMSEDEKAAQQTQSAPLGLNGDTAKKKKKKAKVKGAKKERLENKAKPSTAPPPPPAPTVNPSLGATPAGTTPAQPSAPPAATTPN